MITKLKAILISDTHNKHEYLTLNPEADLIIHAGDATSRSSPLEFESFCGWFKELPYKYKIYVPGNHDLYYTNRPAVEKLLGPGVVYLDEDSVEIEGINFFGTYLDTTKCPRGIDVLITHEPAWGILDELPPGSRFNPDDREPLFLGSHKLRDEIADRIKPKYHFFGHVHEDGGRVHYTKATTYINCAVLNEWYQLVRPSGINLDIIA
jgi:Icc-related predicted phosphoesterase